MPPRTGSEADEARAAAGNVDLGDVARHDDLRPEADPRQEHLHLLGRRVLGLVEDDEARVERPPSHVGEGCHLDRPPLHEPLGPFGLEHVVQGVVERAQVRVDLGHQVARQEAEPLARLDRRPGEDDPVHLLCLQRLHGERDGEVGLARAGRPDAERDHVVGDRLGVALLAGRLRVDAAATRGAGDRRR